jgi:uncharacterized protein YaiL (DUF2058 family)
MSSLQEQLLKAGLVDDKKLARAEQEKNRRTSGKKGAQPDPVRQPVQNKKAQRDRELNQKRQQEAQRKERAAQAKQLIDINKQDRSKGEQPYSFVYRGKVKKIYVTEAQRDQLVAGQLGIATCVTNEETFLVDLGEPAKSDPGEDDPYADYQVPDDLIW